MATDYSLVFCSCPDKNTAKAIAEKVLRARLAACVNISAPSTSLYWWDDHIHSDEEVMLTIKTQTTHLDALFESVQSAHPYEVAELIASPITKGSDAYLNWLKEVTT
ncbi:divalent-cation tolerance protein CutA [Pseudidiomarina sediminum]|uniref:divalent-cation tolerance protein CutA n=1 Tax=Pseudidiomarina sediminum TaxID=431675 RepID=UPI001C945563|nr:divalent-cation tolerance protein CutA [Pseudidiomarina sediminum]MBY6064319.1 divalent-cation tolerance protein CutA [Pseudidiomarina sediminum]